MESAIKALAAYSDRPDGYTRLVDPGLCRAVLDVMADELRPCVSREAEAFAWLLVGYYPSRDVNNPKAYAAGISALMGAYPLKVVEAVCSPVTGLASKLKWLPTLAEVREALDAERARLLKIEGNARWSIAEAERRRKAREEEARCIKTPKQRKAAADAVADFKAMPIVEPPRPRQALDGIKVSPETYADLARRKQEREEATTVVPDRLPEGGA